MRSWISPAFPNMYIYARTYFLSASCVSEFPLATSHDSELHVNLALNSEGTLFSMDDNRDINYTLDHDKLKSGSGKILKTPINKIKM